MGSAPTSGKGSVASAVFSALNNSFLKRRFHDLLFRNSLALSALWGMRAPDRFTDSPYGNTYADLTTILMRSTLRDLVREQHLTRVHEIGIGHYGILCLYLHKHFPGLAISGSTVSDVEIQHATATASLNGWDGNYYLSDVLAAIRQPTELVWWNLPYYDPSVIDYLRRLKVQVRSGSALVPGGHVVLGFNGVPLPPAKVIAEFSGEPDFAIVRTQTYAWNPHVVLTIRYVPVK